MNYSKIRKTDPELYALLRKEIRRQQNTLDLIASENIAPPEIMEAVGTPFMNKYSEGYQGARYYPGCDNYDKLDDLVVSRALRAFGLDAETWHVNVQPLSGAQANFAVYAALMERGGKLLGMELSAGGHLSHGHKVSFTRKFWQAVHYGVDLKTGLIDYNILEELTLKERPDVIVSGFSAYPRRVDFVRFGEIAKKAGAYHLADISHIAGLIAAGVHPSPFPHADVVMTTTHKTLRGPRGAVLFVNRKSEIAHKRGVDIVKAIDRAVFPGLQGGPHNNVHAAKALMFHLAVQPEFRTYQEQVVRNAQALAMELKNLGFKLITGGTDTHLLLVDVKGLGIDGMEAQEQLAAVGIIANRNSLPGDASPFKPSGIRFGTPYLTSRGMKEKEMRQIARLIHGTLIKKEDKRSILRDVKALCKRFPILKLRDKKSR